MIATSFAPRAALRSIAVAVCFATLGSVHALAQAPAASEPSALLAVDQNRATVIDRIVADWGAALVKANAGIDASQLRSLLEAMRADHLLAASLAGSLDGLRQVLSGALQPREQGGVTVKALGDGSIDVVYTPVTPCRLIETRPGPPAVYQTGALQRRGDSQLRRGRRQRRMPGAIAGRVASLGAATAGVRDPGEHRLQR